MNDRCVWCGKVAGCLVLVYAPWRGGWVHEAVCNEHLWRPEYATPQPAVHDGA
jgi:hypothetical protein